MKCFIRKQKCSSTRIQNEEKRLEARRKDKYVEHGEDVENGEAEEHKKTEE